MNAEAAKVNTGNTLEAFPRFAAGAAPGVPLKFPDAEQEQARKLARLNARTGSILGTAAEQLILYRSQLGKGFRVWRSAFPFRAVDDWRGHAYPVFNRLRRLPGVFRTSAASGLLKLDKVHTEGNNSGTAFIGGMSAGFRNRVRSNSPRWRGTREHARQKANTAYRAQFTPAELLERAKRLKQFKLFQSQRKEEVGRMLRRRMTPERYALAHLELVRAARNKPRTLAMLLRDFLRNAQMLASHAPQYLREVLAELRRLRAEHDTYAGFIQHINTAAFVLFLGELAERLADSERIPRPPDLIPLPPAAPLAPPA